MSKSIPNGRFTGVESVVSEPLKFKAKLAIGEDAYTSLRVKNAVFEAWDVLGVASTAASIAKSTAIATRFFAPSGILAAFGVGTAATPIGWVIAASIVTSGAYVGITRYIKGASSSRVIMIPDFINTPMDVLALGLFDLLAPLALKFAAIDGEIHETEKAFIADYFVKDWGYDRSLVIVGLDLIEPKLDEFSIKDLANNLAEFKKGNPDCNYKAMSKEILSFLRGIMEADACVDEREEMALERAEKIFKQVNRFSLKTALQHQKSKFFEKFRGIVRKNATAEAASDEQDV
jgi:hypothetical protein